MKKKSSKRNVPEQTQSEKKTTTDPEITNDLALALPCPSRKRPEPKEDRGLPPDCELKKTGSDYLEFQRANRPEFVDSKYLPEVSGSTINMMVEDVSVRLTQNGGVV